MKRIFVALVMMLAVLAVNGCGGGGDNGSTVVFTETILGNETIDGHITEDFATGELLLTPSPAVLRVGVDPLTQDETRAFLDFSLDAIPANAVITSATLELFTSFPSGTTTIPFLIDLVDFEPPLIASDFDREILLFPTALPPLVTTSRTISVSEPDPVQINVTTLMVEAQNRRLPAFQVRILVNPDFPLTGIMGIEDGPLETAPRLRVTFF